MSTRNTVWRQKLLDDIGHCRMTSGGITVQLGKPKNRFLISMFKNGFESINPVGFSENNPSSNHVEWRYRITNKERYTRVKSTSN